MDPQQSSDESPVQASQTTPQVASTPPVASSTPGVGVSAAQTPANDQALHDIQDAMKRRILRIIAVISVISIVGILFALLISSIEDGSLDERVIEQTDLSSYEVPSAWNSDSDGISTAYFDGTTPASSVVSMIITEPTQATLDDLPLTADETIEFLELFIEDDAQLRDDSVTLGERSTFDSPGFAYAYQYPVTQLADDSITPVIGRLQIRFDDQNYIHITEVAAIKNYWDNNSESLIEILDSYQLLTGS